MWHRPKLHLALSRLSYDANALMAQLLSLYACAGGSEEFQLCMARDERSFNAADFNSALNVLQRDRIGSTAERTVFAQLVERAVLARQAMAGADDAPDEFLCALTMEPMVDPVRLPSGNVVERSAIARHMLSSPTDPYTRVPLTSAELEPLPELAERIRAFGRRNR